MEIIHIMIWRTKTIHPEDSLAKAEEMMETGGFRRLPVVPDDEIAGTHTERNL